MTVCDASDRGCSWLVTDKGQFSKDLTTPPLGNFQPLRSFVLAAGADDAGGLLRG